MSHQHSLKRQFSEVGRFTDSPKECNSTPYKRRKQTSQALEVLGQLIRDGSTDESDNDKFNKNDILSLTLSRLLRRKYWPSHLANIDVELTAGIKSMSIDDDLNGFIVVLNTSGRIILISDNAEFYLRKNVRQLYPQLTSIYDCVSKEDHESIREILSTPNVDERRTVCTWILPRGKRPNRSHTETKSMLLTGHFFFSSNEQTKEPLFIARCEQVLSSTPNMPSSGIGSNSTTTLRFVLTENLNISEISQNTEYILGFKSNQLIDQSIHRILPMECLETIEQAKRNCLSGDHCTSMNVIDMFTNEGERLTFLCNTHTLIEGRRRTTKLGFFAQLIDPSMRYECLRYANKQNIERQKNSFQQKTNFQTNWVLNDSTKTNVAHSPRDQCLSTNVNEKRRAFRNHQQYSGAENVFNPDPSQIIPQSSFEFNWSGPKVSSMKHEIGHFDDFFVWSDEQKGKVNFEFPQFENYQENFDHSFNNFPDFSLYTPTVLETNFFG